MTRWFLAAATIVVITTSITSRRTAAADADHQPPEIDRSTSPTVGLPESVLQRLAEQQEARVVVRLRAGLVWDQHEDRDEYWATQVRNGELLRAIARSFKKELGPTSIKVIEDLGKGTLPFMVLQVPEGDEQNLAESKFVEDVALDEVTNPFPATSCADRWSHDPKVLEACEGERIEARDEWRAAGPAPVRFVVGPGGSATLLGSDQSPSEKLDRAKHSWCRDQNAYGYERDEVDFAGALRCYETSPNPYKLDASGALIGPHPRRIRDMSAAEYARHRHKWAYKRRKYQEE